MSELVRLHPHDLERLADMLAPRIADALRARPAAELVDAAELARRFALTPEWVRDHKEELGVIRLGEDGEGKRPRLRFDPEHVAGVLRRRSEHVRSPDADPPVMVEDRPRGGERRSGNGLDALPVRQLKPIAQLSNKRPGGAQTPRPWRRGLQPRRAGSLPAMRVAQLPFAAWLLAAPTERSRVEIRRYRPASGDETSEGHGVGVALPDTERRAGVREARFDPRGHDPAGRRAGGEGSARPRAARDLPHPRRAPT